jgi:nucleoside-diphosphate-sugar epimerase
VRVVILRVPGIYAADRLPVARIERGTPALAPAEDAFVNHVHADDLARIIVAALYRGGGGRMYNASDDAPIRMGDYFDLVAEHFGLPHPPRVTRAEAESVLSAQLLSFMNESRRLTNRRIKDELRMKLRYPTVRHGIAAARADRPARG